MAEFKISRFRYTWKGEWDTNTVTYNKDDIVLYQGKSWVCIRQHSPSTFGADQTYTPPGNTDALPAWVKMTDGRKFLGDWSPSILYDEGVLVLAGGNVYIALATHTSAAQFATDILKWEVFATGSNFRNTWAVSTRYRVGDVVRYNGYTYECVLEHTSGTTTDGVIVGNADADADSTAETWKVVVENYTYVGTYAANTRYRLNDLVKYGGSILRCTAEHTSSFTPGLIDNEKFTNYLLGFNNDGFWNGSSYYSIGDVVTFGGSIYAATENNINKSPGVTVDAPQGSTSWNLISKAQSFKGEYDPTSGTLYNQGDLVRRGGSLWVSLLNQAIGEDSSLNPNDDSNWQLVISSYNFRRSWASNESYNLYDVVYFKGTTYYSNIPHLSTLENFPGDNGEGFNYWSILVLGDPRAALSALGDMITYNLSRLEIQDGSSIASIGDGSTFNPTPVQIGSEDQLLVVEDNLGSIGYKTWGNVQRVFHVRTNGVDDATDPNRGINYFKPFKTVRYALEQADDGYAGTTTVLVSGGEYQEVLPLIVPARTAVVGEELRSTCIRANEPIAALAQDAQYTLETLIRIGLVIDDIVLGNVIQSNPANTIPQITAGPTTSPVAQILNNLWADIITMIDARVNGEVSEPTVTGSNTASTDLAVIAARNILEANREFIKAEAIEYMATENPAYLFDTAKCERDLDRFIDAVKYDLLYTGNYKSVLAGRYYANAVTGSQLEDMFYVRDTSGIRNMTLKGLEGTLPALSNNGKPYRIPTGGAFVSLDPGWGPADERTWIINRSCYVQNVTTIGTGAVGQKVDGNLHNGGNKSIVSNDFTQVISDGIGAWMLNGGRGELVSVFSYYAHIGMFSLDGGIIRATNGNSSYGDFGAVADGIDPEETVRYGQLNTRDNQAVVAAAFAGEVNDYILALEFENCGQEYTTASYTITSSGTGAVLLQEETRDNAMYVCYVTSAGTAFSQYGNQAQFGNTLTITLATAETVEEADILGMRLILTSGEGTGQYGYVQAYNDLSKVCTIYRESDNQPGWDNVLPGTPNNPLLTTGTRYRIEPRPIFSEPGYDVSTQTMVDAGAWSAAVFGETSNTYTNVIGSSGTGTTIEVIPVAARFTVIKTGRTYTVTVTNGGAGYAPGDTIVIDGANIGGTSIEHDITITVVSTTDDSTNAVVSFNYQGVSIANSGKFILAPSSGRFGRYSSDGGSWISFDFPTDGNWKCLAAGNNRFVAIANASNNAASSTDGVTWIGQSMPSSRNWNGVAYGSGIFLAVAGNLNAGAYSINGTSWLSTTLPTVGDSTINEWVDVAYGVGKFVALANSNNVVAIGTFNTTTSIWTWTSSIMDVIADSSQRDWVSITYGNRRFVAISSTGDVAYSFDGLIWYAATMPTQDGSTAHNWKQIRYGQGVFFAVGDTGSKTVGADPTTGPTTFAATSYDGIVWTSRTLSNELDWGVVAFGNPDITLGDSTASNNKPTWVVAPTTSSIYVNRVYTGARALGRVVVDGAGISGIKIWEPGSGYTSDPVLTLIDPNNTNDPVFRPRLADGVLAQPTLIDRGSAYKTSTTSLEVFGDGFADITPNGRFITVDDLTVMPGPGAQFYIGGDTEYYTAVIVGLDEVLLPNGLTRARFQVSPRPVLADYLEHGMEVLIRERYSQVRITGHDFLDIGTGNFEETNYPELYRNYDFEPEPFQEVQNLNGGRVFYTSTDQSGNFRAGELFAVEQATGVITISADFFDLQGLTELRLGGVSVGSTAVIREFSKDPLFNQNSNNIIPTQKAVRSYLQSRLNVGGEDLLTPSFIAGTVKVGPNLITSSAGLTIDIPVIADFTGAACGLSGSILAQTLFFRSFTDE
jgi:hypothetical protein